MELEVLIKSVTAKLGVLELTRKRIETSLEEASNNNKRDIEKKLRSREGKIDEVHDLVLEIQEAKLLSGETPDAVELWGNEIAERTKVHTRKHSKGYTNNPGNNKPRSDRGKPQIANCRRRNKTCSCHRRKQKIRARKIKSA